jgi:16S rRNA (guanine1207-N2)-methyltransferase
MFSDRYSFAMRDGADLIPDGATCGVFNATDACDVSGLSGDITVVQGFAPFVDQLTAAGIRVTQHAHGPFDVAVVLLPKSKKLARDLIYQATQAVPNGTVLVDGQKTDGIDSILKDLKKQVSLSTPVSKAHGKLAWFSTPAQVPDYADTGMLLPQGFATSAGVFSADGIDPASQLLARLLPPLRGTVADLGAGWGYLTHTLCNSPTITQVFAVEADFASQQLIAQNVPDERVVSVWADATQWRAPKLVDVVVMNPPFHVAGRADPALGQAFIHNAAANLSPQGQLFMVANRHLPYESVLEASFQSVQELTGTPQFKVYHAARPKRTKR